MAIGTLLTGVFLFAFTAAKNEAAVLGFNCVTALTQNIVSALPNANSFISEREDIF